MNVREPATAIGCPYCLEPLRAESMSGNVVADSMLASALTIQIRTALHAHSLVRLVSSKPLLKSIPVIDPSRMRYSIVPAGSVRYP